CIFLILRFVEVYGRLPALSRKGGISTQENKSIVAQATKANGFVASSSTGIAGEKDCAFHATFPRVQKLPGNCGPGVASATQLGWCIDSTELNDIRQSRVKSR